MKRIIKTSIILSILLFIVVVQPSITAHKNGVSLTLSMKSKNLFFAVVNFNSQKGPGECVNYLVDDNNVDKNYSTW